MTLGTHKDIPYLTPRGTLWSLYRWVFWGSLIVLKQHCKFYIKPMFLKMPLYILSLITLLHRKWLIWTVLLLWCSNCLFSTSLPEGLTHCGLVTAEIWVNIGSGNGLLPDCTKPLPNQCWLIISEVQVTFILGQFHKSCLNHKSLKSVWKLHIQTFIQICPEPMN